jgi:hypothetical protein
MEITALMREFPINAVCGLPERSDVTLAFNEHTLHNNPLSQRWHRCACGIGPVEEALRDLYSADLSARLDPCLSHPLVCPICRSPTDRCRGGRRGTG